MNLQLGAGLTAAWMLAFAVCGGFRGRPYLSLEPLLPVAVKPAHREEDVSKTSSDGAS